MKLEVNEKSFLEKIIAISGIDKKVAQVFFKSLLTACTASIYADENEIIIPYLCKLKIVYKKVLTQDGVKLEVELKADPSEELIEEIKCIVENIDPPTKVYFKKEIDKELKRGLEIDEIEL